MSQAEMWRQACTQAERPVETEAEIGVMPLLLLLSMGFSKKFIPVFPWEGKSKTRMNFVANSVGAKDPQRWPRSLQHQQGRDFLPTAPREPPANPRTSRFQDRDDVRVSCSVLSDSLRPRGLRPARLLCPWDSPGQSAAAGRPSLSRASSPPRDGTHVSSLGRWVLYRRSLQGSPLGRYVCCFSPSAGLCPRSPSSLLPSQSGRRGRHRDRPRVVPAAHRVHWAPVSFPLDISRICPLASRGFGPVFLSPGPWQRLLLSPLRLRHPSPPSPAAGAYFQHSDPVVPLELKSPPWCPGRPLPVRTPVTVSNCVSTNYSSQDPVSR